MIGISRGVGADHVITVISKAAGCINQPVTEQISYSAFDGAENLKFVIDGRRSDRGISHRQIAVHLVWKLYAGLQPKKRPRGMDMVVSELQAADDWAELTVLPIKSDRSGRGEKGLRLERGFANSVTDDRARVEATP